MAFHTEILSPNPSTTPLNKSEVDLIVGLTFGLASAIILIIILLLLIYFKYFRKGSHYELTTVSLKNDIPILKGEGIKIGESIGKGL